MAAAADAYQQAGVTDPRAQLAMAEVHDCFTPTELVLMEDLGFAERGMAWKEVLAGTFDLDGELPVNPDGGLKAFGHPIGASGLRMLFEGWLQLRGEAGERQIKTVAEGKKLALTHNLGGQPGECVSYVGVVGSEPATRGVTIRRAAAAPRLGVGRERGRPRSTTMLPGMAGSTASTIASCSDPVVSEIAPITSGPSALPRASRKPNNANPVPAERRAARRRRRRRGSGMPIDSSVAPSADGDDGRDQSTWTPKPMTRSATPPMRSRPGRR